MRDGLRIWVLADERAGTANQALGVAEALRLPFEVKNIKYTGGSRLPNFLKGASTIGLTRDSKLQIRGPWPDIVISAGRRLVPLARYIYKCSGYKAFLCHIMYPDLSDLSDFKLIAVPRHDRIQKEAPNILTITGAPHRVTALKLQEGRMQWEPAFAHLPRPLTAVIIGGGPKGRPMNDRTAAEFVSQVRSLTKDEGGLLITNSRRTSPEATDFILSQLKQPSFVYRVESGAKNPYFGFLALADRIIVSGDSVSMCSEACSTRKKVYLFTPKELISEKHARLHEELYALGYARPLEYASAAGECSDSNLPPFNAAERIAAEIIARLKEEA